MDVAELLSFQPDRGTKRKGTKEEDNAIEEDTSSRVKKILKRNQGAERQPHSHGNDMLVNEDGGSLSLGSGTLTEEEKEKILAMVENDVAEGEAIDGAAVKRHVLSFEKKVTKNQEMRIKFADHPERFMESEVELHDEIQKLHVLATVPEYYGILVKLGTMNTFLGLLTHENSDISISVVDLLQEMTDVDTLNESEESATALIQALMDGQVIAVLVQNLERLDENNKEDADGVHNSLAIVENMSDFNPEMTTTAGEQGLITWLVKRVKLKGFNANKLYASEILAIMLQNSEENRQLLGDVNGVDVLLQALAIYKRVNPTSASEIEYMENLFDCLCSTLLLPPNKEMFLKGEGLQLMLLMLRGKNLCRLSALKVLNYVVTGSEGGDNCNKFIEIRGLSSIFPLFMKPPKRSKKSGVSSHDVEEHTCSIISSLFRHATGPNRTRLVQKFVEADHIKVDRLLELYFNYLEKVLTADAKIEKEKDAMEAAGEVIDDALDDEFYLRRLDAGLFTLQLVVCIVMEASCSGVSSVKDRIMQILGQRGGSMKRLRHIMREYAGHVGDASTKDSSELERMRLLSLVDRF